MEDLTELFFRLEARWTTWPPEVALPVDWMSKTVFSGLGYKAI